MVLFLSFALVAVILGIIGATAGGLGYPLIVGIVIFAADVAFASLRLSRRARRPLR
ncbi:hypothetical protein ACFW93_00490 [Streptomyces canus]|uniref:hypothetical protein n=1 Tax=Streptomyces canus TaxID=58343 RepID=UPI0036C322F5